MSDDFDSRELNNKPVGGDRLPTLDVGEYMLCIDDVIKTKPTKPGDGIALIVEFTVLASSNPEVAVGSKRKWYRPMLWGTDEIIRFVTAAYGYDAKRDAAVIERDVSPSIGERLNAAKDARSLAGKPIKASVFMKPPSAKKLAQNPQAQAYATPIFSPGGPVVPFTPPAAQATNPAVDPGYAAYLAAQRVAAAPPPPPMDPGYAAYLAAQGKR